MKKLVILMCLVVICLAGVACGGNGDGGDGGQGLTTQQIFSKFETVQINMENYDGSLDIEEKREYFSGQNKEQMNTEGHWCEKYTEYLGYNNQTGECYQYVDRYAWVDVYKTSKVFSGGQIGYYEYGNMEGVLVDSKYGSYAIKEGRFENREFSRYYGDSNDGINLNTYKNCVSSLEDYKTSQIEFYDSVGYTISAKKEASLYVIEVKITRDREADEHNGSSDEDITYKYTFNDTTFLKYERVSENFGHGLDNTDTWYHYEKEESDISTTFSQEGYDNIDKSSYTLPSMKITRELNIYRDGANFTAYDVEFGTKLSDFVQEIHISQKENTKGYNIYVDENNTKLLTDEVMSSYKNTSLYYVSIPEDDYATINTRYIYEKSTGERKIEKAFSSIERVTDYTFPEYPSYHKQHEVKNYYDGGKYYFEDIYVNGQKLDSIFTEVRSGNTYYVDVVHKEDQVPVVVNVYDNHTGKIWKTFNSYENGTLWSHIEQQILYNQSYYGANLLYLSTSFSLPNGSNTDNHPLLKVEGRLDVYMTVRSISVPAVSRNNMFRYDDLTTSTEIDKVEVRNIQSGGYLTFNLDEYDTFIVDGYEFRKDGVEGNITGYDFYYVYDRTYGKLNLSLGGKTYDIQYKRFDGLIQ